MSFERNRYYICLFLAQLKILRNDSDALLSAGKEELMKMMAKMIKGDTPEQLRDSIVVRENDESPDIILSRIQRLQRFREVSRNAIRTGLRKQVSDTMASWTNQHFDPVQQLKDQLGRQGKTEKEVDWKKVEMGDIMYISRKFDLLEWWEKIGSKQHELVFLATLPFLALPASNAFVERLFRTCTWFDSPLCQRLKHKRFEMAVLTAANESFLLEKDSESSEQDKKEIVNKVFKIYEKNDAGFTAEDDLGIDVCQDNLLAV